MSLNRGEIVLCCAVLTDRCCRNEDVGEEERVYSKERK